MTMKYKNVLFISAPYGNADDKEKRAEQIRDYSAGLLAEGVKVICPMTLGLALANNGKFELPKSTEFWLDWTLTLLKKCDEMIVLCFDGWEDSVGVKAEIEVATQNNIPITYTENI